MRSARSLVVEGLVEACRAVGALREDTIELVSALEHLVAWYDGRLHVVNASPNDTAEAVRPASVGSGMGLDGLTPRENEVLALIAEDVSNGEIARRLFVSEATVKTHINKLFAEAYLRDRAHAVSYAYTHGLVEL